MTIPVGAKWTEFGSAASTTDGSDLVWTSSGYLNSTARAGIAMTAGKWYWELEILAMDTGVAGNSINFGIWPASRAIGTYIYDTSGVYRSYGAAAVNDIFGFAFDAGTGDIDVYRNGSHVGTGKGSPLSITEAWYPVIGDDNNGGAQVRANFGGAAFTYTPPTGFVAANTGLYSLSGVTRNASGTFAARTVRAFREDTGAFVGTAVSDGTTGAYSIATADTSAHTLVAYPAGGEALPALVLRGVIPIES